MTQEIKFQDGGSYEQWMGVWSQLVGDQFLEWLSPQPDATWIDIGCGNGTFTEQIYNAHAPKEIQALDPSPEARRRRPARGWITKSTRPGEAQ